MGKRMISARINVDKIEKERLFKGEKGKYLDITIFINDEKDQYENNGFMVQQVTKEEREKGVKGPILGNVRYIEFAGNNEASPQDTGGKAAAAPTAAAAQEADDDLPF